MQNIVLQVISNKKINQSSLKAIACTFMLLSHFIMCIGWQGWGGIPGTYTSLLEMLGQIAFPLYSFALICSWECTKDKRKFILNLALLSVISQIPYVMALYPANLQAIDITSKKTYFTLIGVYFIICLISCIGLWSEKVLESKKEYIVLFILVFMASYNLCVNYIWLNYTDKLNVAYLFWSCLVIFYVTEQWSRFSLVEKLVKVICIILVIVFFIARSDFGIYGGILISCLYLLRKNRIFQCICILIWGIILYLGIYGNIFNSFSSIIAAIIISRYNGKRGSIDKRYFYVFYPLHLIVLGIMNIMIKF